MINVPVRVFPSLRATVNRTVPSPTPLCPDVIVIQDTWLVAVHAQPSVASTSTLLFPPPFLKSLLFRESSKLHTRRSCDTVNVRPAMVSVPVRVELPVLGATLKLTFPFPLPLAPEVTVIHDALLVAVHAQPEVVETWT